MMNLNIQNYGHNQRFPPTADYVRCVAASNSMYLEAVSPSVMKGGVRTSDAQLQCLRRIQVACQVAGRPPNDLSPAEALRELRIAGPYEDECPLGPVAFNPDRVALRAEGTLPVPLDVLWGDGGTVFVERLTSSCLVPSTTAAVQLTDAPDAAFSDSSFGNILVWEDFVWRLSRAGLVDFVDEVVEITGVFFVPKKNGKQRMVLDARRSNCWFVRAEGVSLCTGSSLANIELGSDDTLYVGQADLSNAFYHIGLPEALRPYFGLKQVRHLRAPADLRHMLGHCTAQSVHPRLRVTPMGFSWAFLDLPADSP
jgi:hypothetical protein